jgi:hypothetical protein
MKKKIEAHIYIFFLDLHYRTDDLTAFLIKLHGLNLISYSLIMCQYPHFIFIFIQLLIVRSEDSNLNSFFHRKLFTTTNRPKFVSASSFPTNDRPLGLHSHVFYDPFYSKTQTTKPITAEYNLRGYNKTYIPYPSVFQYQSGDGRLFDPYNTLSDGCYFYTGKIS